MLSTLQGRHHVCPGMQVALSPPTMRKLCSLHRSCSNIFQKHEEHEKKKLGKARVSEAGHNEVTEMKKDLSEMCPYLQWLDHTLLNEKHNQILELLRQTECSEISDFDNENSASMSQTISPDGGISGHTVLPNMKVP